MIMKKIISTLLSLVLVIGMLPIMASADEVTPAWDGTAAESFAGGAGTKSDPWQIETAAQLKLASDTVNAQFKDYFFILNNDIDYENQQWAPIGHSNASNSTFFRGGFDGNEHIVKNLKVNYNESVPYTYCGFFGLAKNVTITDLGIENLQIDISNPSTSDLRARYIGGFAATLRGNSTVDNCYIKNSTVSQPTGNCEYVGVSAFVNVIHCDGDGDPKITNCYAYDVHITPGYQRVATGFVAKLTGNTATLTNCYTANIHPVQGRTLYPFGYMGSNTAYSETYATLQHCYSASAAFEAPTNGGGNALSETSKFGTEVQIASQINETLKDLNGWQDGTYINGGFPALAWEKAPIEVKDFADGAVTLDVNKAIDGAKVYVAAYDGTTGRLISADVADVATTVPVNVTTTGATIVKVFVWDADLTPLADAISKPL